MSYELVFVIILAGSLLGIVVILFRKIPLLAKLPEAPIEFKFKEGLLVLKEKLEKSKYFKLSSWEVFLQKGLSKTRILVLKTENKTAVWLESLRQRAIKRKNNLSDNYWQEIRKSKKRK